MIRRQLPAFGGFAAVWLASMSCWAATSELPPIETDWPAEIDRIRSSSFVTETARRKELASAYNNYGVRLSNDGKLPEALKQLEQAMSLDRDNAQVRRNLGLVHIRVAHTAYQGNRIQDAKQAAQKALSLDPKLAEGYQMLGELEYQAQRLKEAKTAWTKALELDPELPGVKDRLDQLGRELPVESQFERVSQAYFDVRYTDTLEAPAGYDIRDELVRARREVGTDFAYWPRHKLVVLVYKADEFRTVKHDTPSWTGGQYDGKIRVPVSSRAHDRAEMTRALFHEYTHAVIHALTNNRCPPWLNEGLAEYEAWKGQTAPWDQLRGRIAAGDPVPWPELDQWFSGDRSAEDAALGYQQAHSISLFLVERFGMWRIRRILKMIGDGTSADEALAKEIPIKRARLERDWLAWLRKRLP